jgi:hypothetical protein
MGDVVDVDTPSVVLGIAQGGVVGLPKGVVLEGSAGLTVDGARGLSSGLEGCVKVPSRL